jgi:hypothetical protein
LRNTDPSHLSTSELFRPKQGVHQVNKQRRRNDACDGVFHGILLKALRRRGKTPQQGKEDNHNTDIEEIQQHGSPSLYFPKAD